mmetsp:Transcript_97543/g.259105  ORF Transcript_97543/g.259105 Transcript_97543/m.259105 type:complete len:287 (-) Transcript_97543:130-990(-)
MAHVVADTQVDLFTKLGAAHLLFLLFSLCLLFLLPLLLLLLLALLLLYQPLVLLGLEPRLLLGPQLGLLLFLLLSLLLRLQGRHALLVPLAQRLLRHDALLLVGLLHLLRLLQLALFGSGCLPLLLVDGRLRLVLGLDSQLAPRLRLLAQLCPCCQLVFAYLLPLRQATTAFPAFADQAKVCLAEGASSLISDVLAGLLLREAGAAAPPAARDTEDCLGLAALVRGPEVMAVGLQREAHAMDPASAQAPIRCLLAELCRVVIGAAVLGDPCLVLQLFLQQNSGVPH